MEKIDNSSSTGNFVSSVYNYFTGGVSWDLGRIKRIGWGWTFMIWLYNTWPISSCSTGSTLQSHYTTSRRACGLLYNKTASPGDYTDLPFLLVKNGWKKFLPVVPRVSWKSASQTDFLHFGCWSNLAHQCRFSDCNEYLKWLWRGKLEMLHGQLLDMASLRRTWKLNSSSIPSATLEIISAKNLIPIRTLLEPCHIGWKRAGRGWFTPSRENVEVLLRAEGTRHQCESTPHHLIHTLPAHGLPPYFWFHHFSCMHSSQIVTLVITLKNLTSPN